MRYCKVKTTGQVIETQSGDGDLEMFYGNNSTYSRDELEVGIADDEVVRGWLSEQAEAAKSYSDKRKEEYAKLNQFEMQFDDQRDGTTTWVDAINGIKDKYPKE